MKATLEHQYGRQSMLVPLSVQNKPIQLDYDKATSLLINQRLKYIIFFNITAIENYALVQLVVVSMTTGGIHVNQLFDWFTRGTNVILSKKTNRCSGDDST